MKSQQTVLYQREIRVKSQRKNNLWNSFSFLVLFSLLFLFANSLIVHSQTLISDNPDDHPVGYEDPDDPDYIRLLPADPGVDYVFVVNLLSDQIVIHSASMNSTPCSNGSSPITSVFYNGVPTPPPALTITIPGDWICTPTPDIEERYLDVSVEVQDGGGEQDDQFFRIPIARDPVKIAMVLDISGSMSLPTPGDDIDLTPRWDVLKLAVISFIDKLELLRQSGDSLALTYFTTTIIQPAFPTTNNFIDITLPEEEAPKLTSSDSVFNDMDNRHPLNMTSMGQGLLDGKAKLNGNNPDPDGAKKIVLLFTDGLQNIAPLVDDTDGQTLSDGQKLNDCDPSCASEDSVRYYTISIGAGPLVPEVLENIATHNSGFAVQSTVGDEFDFYDFFNTQWVNMLYSSSPQMIRNEVGMLVSGEATHSYQLNKNLSYVLFELISEDSDSIEMVVQKNGIEINPTVYQQDNIHKLMGFKMPLKVEDTRIYSDGEWEVVLSGTISKRYLMTCFADDHLLNFYCNLDKSIYTVEDAIQLSVQLSYAGEPITGDDMTVEALVFKPGDDLGHLLSTYETPEGTTGEDVMDPAQKKFQDLLAGDTAFYHALLPEKQIIELESSGNGQFHGAFDETELTGVYKIVFTINGKLPSVGNIERTKLVNTVFKFGQVVEEEPEVVDDAPPPSAGASSGLTVLRIRPINKFGYYLGPGFTSKIKFGIPSKPSRSQKTSLGFPENGEGDPSPYLLEIMDNLDGSYFLYLVNVRGNPRIEINVRGEIQYDGKVWPLPTWFFILGILIFLAIFLVRLITFNAKKIVINVLWILLIVWLLIFVLQNFGIAIIF